MIYDELKIKGIGEVKIKDGRNIKYICAKDEGVFLEFDREVRVDNFIRFEDVILIGNNLYGKVRLNEAKQVIEIMGWTDIGYYVNSKGDYPLLISNGEYGIVIAPRVLSHDDSCVAVVQKKLGSYFESKIKKRGDGA